MKILALETSERIGSLAAFVADDQSPQLAAEATLPSDQRGARSLIPAIGSLLDQLGWKPTELDLICVTTGPGSFTGTRLGVTTAKTLAYATNAQLVGVHTLAAIAAGVPTSYDRLWAILDAQRKELFVSQFSAAKSSDFGESPDTKILSTDAWLAQLKPGELVCGPPLEKLRDRLPQGVLCADPAQWTPRAENVGRLGIAAFQSGATVDPMQLVPQYYRKSAAEEKADAAESDS